MLSFHTPRHTVPSGRTAVGTALHVLAVICMLLTALAITVALAAKLNAGQAVDASMSIRVVGALVAGLTIGGLMLGFGTIVNSWSLTARHAFETHRPDADDPLAGGDDDGRGAGAVSPNGIPVETLRQIQNLLREIRDVTVVASDERESVHERIRGNLQRHAAEEIIEAVNRRQLGRARGLLGDAESTYGQTPVFEKLASRIEDAANRAEALDFARAKRLVEEAIADRAWAEAESLAERLHHNHPSSPRCRTLWEDARRSRLFAHIERCARDHRWSEALAASEEFLERFPESTESRSLRNQLETLRENTEIAARKQMESRLTEMLSVQHYDEALRLAKHLVEAFPHSPQADALREQIPRLEKRVTV